MKDLPHHMKKLNRRVIRSMHRDELEAMLPDLPPWEDSEREKKKKAKQKEAEKRKNHVPIKKTQEERNQEMKRGRAPIFDRHQALPKHAKPSKKKTPKI